MTDFKANPGKKLLIEVDDIEYIRIPITTKLITPNDQLEDILDHYVYNLLADGDILFIAEKVIACMQHRLINIADVKPRFFARLLAEFVYKNPADLNDPGLGLPESMEVVMQELGATKIIFATIVAAIGKVLGKRGWFYKIAGPLARDIDGPTPYVIHPYRNYIFLNPENAQKVAESAKAHIKCDVVIVDINDLGGNILGNTSTTFSDNLISKILKDNPLGQSDEQTPLGIIRKQEVAHEEI